LDEDQFNPFGLPYFLTTWNGERHSRARYILDGICNRDDPLLGMKLDPVPGAKLARDDFVAAALAMNGANDEQRALSEAVLSALALGLLMARTTPEMDAVVKRILTDRARRAADVRQKENREIKAEALEWYKQHRNEYASKDAAAQYIATRVVPGTAFGTVRRWLREPRNGS